MKIMFILENNCFNFRKINQKTYSGTKTGEIFFDQKDYKKFVVCLACREQIRAHNSIQ